MTKMNIFVNALMALSHCAAQGVIPVFNMLKNQ